MINNTNATTNVEKKAEKPLTKSETVRVIALASVLVILSYIFSLTALVIVLLLLLFDFLILIGAARFGLVGLMVEPIKAVSKLAFLIARSLNLRDGPVYNVQISRKEAPRLYDVVADIARQVGVKPPDSIVLESGCNAWVRLRGYRTGRGHCTLGIGIGTLVISTLDEFKSVIAHEMAHAKLFERGYGNWVANAMARTGQLAYLLGDLVYKARSEDKKFYLAQVLWQVNKIIARNGNRLVATYRRQHEFAADQVAAELYGNNNNCNSLIKMAVAIYMNNRLSWQDIIAQTQRDGSFCQWLLTKLTPESEEERKEIEQKVLYGEERSEYDTHPILADRIVSLPETDEESPYSEPAIVLLNNLDDMAIRLINHIEHIASQEQQKDSQQLQKAIRQSAGEMKFNSLQFLGIITAIIGCLILIWTFAASNESGWDIGRSLSNFSIGVLCIATGILLIKYFPQRERLVLPVPSYADWRRTDNDIEQRKSDIINWYYRISEQMKAEMPKGLKGKRNLARYWGTRCYEALIVCDYQRAWAASQLCLAADPKCLEGLLSAGIASRYFFEINDTANVFGQAISKYNIRGSVLWAFAWASILIDEYDYAEGYLLNLTKEWPRNPTLLSLLAYSQWRRNKLYEALENIKRAIKLAPQDVNCRILLLRLLLAQGRPKDALEQMRIIEPLAANDEEVMLCAVQMNLLLGRDEEADRRAALAEQMHQRYSMLIRLAQLYSSSERYEVAQRYCEKVCQMGFYPNAYVGLAHIANEQKDKEKAREYLLKALDVTRELPLDADGPFSVLGDACNLMLSLQEPVSGCEGWTVTIDMRDSPAKVERVSFLLAAPSFEDARAIACEIYAAMHPGSTLEDWRTKWEKLPPENQPEGLTQPGVHGMHIE
ncbi:MAG TPA: M48 family metalloprotease [Armatimonadota bacterium]|nr:M48 family metalloprotease [Armatimonadota bacterium]